MRLFIMTSLLAFSAFTATIKEYKDCRLKSINFESSSFGDYVFNCNGEEKRFSRYSKLAEEDLLFIFTTKNSFFTSETKNLLVVPAGMASTTEENIAGFITSGEIKSLKKISFNRLNGKIIDPVGNVLLTVTKEQVENSELNQFSGLKIKFRQGPNKLVIQRTADSQYVNTLSVVENCFPKSCGQTTYLLLRENAIIGSFPESDGLHRE